MRTGSRLSDADTAAVRTAIDKVNQVKSRGRPGPRSSERSTTSSRPARR